MLDSVFKAIEEWMHKLLSDVVHNSLDTLFDEVNRRTGEIAVQVGMTPQQWNSSVFTMIQNLSNSVIVPIAGLIITFVLCYELITMLTEKNNLHDVDTWMFFKWFFKAFVAIWLVTNTFNITMAIFDVGQYVVNAAAGVITGTADIDTSTMLATIDTQMESMETGELLILALEALLVNLSMKILSVLITLILYGRMIEIYLLTSVAPIPFATFANREASQIGKNFLKSLAALAFQAFLMMVVVGIYAALVSTISLSDNLHYALFGLMGYTVLLCFSLFKTGSISKSIFTAS